MSSYADMPLHKGERQLTLVVAALVLAVQVACVPVPRSVRSCSLGAPLLSAPAVVAVGQRPGGRDIVALIDARANLVAARDFGYRAEVVAAPGARALYALCTDPSDGMSALVAFTLPDLTERWRVQLARPLYQIPVPPQVAASEDGEHLAVIERADAGADMTLDWLVFRLTRDGRESRRIELPHCGVAAVLSAGGGEDFVVACFGSALVHWARPSLGVVATVPGPSELSAVARALDNALVFVTRSLRVGVIAASSGGTKVVQLGSDAGLTLGAFEAVPMAPDGTRIWYQAAGAGGETYVVSLDLGSGARELARVDGLNGLGRTSNELVLGIGSDIRVGTAVVPVPRAHDVRSWRFTLIR